MPGGRGPQIGARLIVASFRERNDRKPRSDDTRKPHGDKGFRKGPRTPQAGKQDFEGWIWGRHAVEAALLNRERTGAMRLVATQNAAKDLEPVIARSGRALRVEPVEAHDLNRMLPPGASHQGMALRTQPLEGVGLHDLVENGPGVIVMLDQLTDPQNVGAIFRSAAAFGAKGVVLQDRNSPQLSGALAKAAAGAIERVPCARVVNLSRALEQLADMGWRAVGLDGSAEETLEEALDERPTVLVMGSEGEGLRRLVAEHCDTLAKIPMPGEFESLNVSNAAAVALYEASRRHNRNA
ncbi:MAG: 23S rRNA (guanosine(2251)-2'-O)-methyltransferase RlmB [Proteobacteria bacterium]|nr:23S rRNA (guanosine(2251)-2'-O)-methyltransferase RlmB [Pseudomonadota bacterium]